MHGLSSSSVYDAWIAMKARCFNKQNPNFHYYGGRGITVCEDWKSSFETFLRDMGQKPFDKATLDRIDVNGDYKPENCRWISIQMQQRNRRDNNDFPGIYFEPSRKRWRADITYFGKRIFLGRFKDLEGAKSARTVAENTLCNSPQPQH